MSVQEVETAEVESDESDETSVDETSQVKMTIGELSLMVPRKFTSGHVLTVREALALDSFVRSRFVSNMRSDIERREKVYTVEELAEKYASYELGAVRAPGEATQEKIRFDAAIRVVAEIFKEHNALVESTGEGPLGKNIMSLPSGKGSKPVREAFANRVLSQDKYAERVQTAIDAITAERGAKRDSKKDVTKASAAQVDLL